MHAPEGRITRGTTGTNRLRRVDRYIAASDAFRIAPEPLVVDLGFGARPWTAIELAERLGRVRADVRVVGLEIDPARVAAASTFANERVTFALGGFEVPVGGRPAVIRAMNVLRQYDESEVHAAWASMRARLAPGGTVVEGTCDEIGRIASWVDLDSAGPVAFTISLRLRDLERPGVVAERLPKALIHHNVRGERVHALLEALDDAWARAAGIAVFGPPQRFQAAAAALLDAGWPVARRPKRWRLGELTVPWTCVAP